MSHVFISYAHEDFEFADRLADFMKQNQFQVWMDTELNAGFDWRMEIDTAIQKCRAVVLIVSPASLVSQYVLYEWAYALGAGKHIIPVIYRGPDISKLHERLSKLQRIDFSGRRRNWQALLRALRPQTAQLPTLDEGDESEIPTDRNEISPLIMASQSELTQRIPLPVGLRQPNKFYLHVLNSRGLAVKSFLLQERYVMLGRDQECNIVIPHERVSREHLRFIRSDRTYAVEDLGSSNGTLLNNNKLNLLQVLDDKQEIVLAQTIRLRFEIQY